MVKQSHTKHGSTTLGNLPEGACDVSGKRNPDRSRRGVGGTHGVHAVPIPSEPLTSAAAPPRRLRSEHKLQALVYDILPSTTAVEEGVGKRCSECGLSTDPVEQRGKRQTFKKKVLW